MSSKISTALRAAALGQAPSRRDAQLSGPGAWDLPSDAICAVLDWRCDAERIRSLAENEQRMFFLFVAEAEE